MGSDIVSLRRRKMAVVVINQSANWNQDLYDQVAKKVFGGTLTPVEKPDGLITHTAGPDPDGGWIVADIWESEAKFNAFLQATIIPAAMEIGAPPFDTKIVSLHNYLK